MKQTKALGTFVLLTSLWNSASSPIAAFESVVGPPPSIGEVDLDPAVAELLETMVGAAIESPMDGELRGQLGLAYEANGIARAARTAYEQATTLTPQAARWWYHLARARARQGNLAAALRDLDHSLASDDTYAPSHWRQGAWRLELGDLESAERSLRAAIERDPDSVAAHALLARVFLRQQESEAAIGVLVEQVGRNPRQTYLHHLLAIAYRQAGRAEEARSHALLAGQAQEPRWRDPWKQEMSVFEVAFGARHRRAIRLAGIASRRPEALELFEALHQERPEDVTVINNLGATYLDQGETEKALQLLIEGLRHTVENYALHLNLSTAYERQHQLTLAEEHIDLSISANPFFSASHVQKGRYLVRRKEFGRALETFALARRYDARDPSGWIWSGWIHCELREWSIAASDFSAALATDPRSAEAYLGLALARAELGENAAARRAFGSAADLAPGEPRMPAIGRRILRLGGFS